MHFDDDELYSQENAESESGSDELLAADDLRLPDSASILVRLHALRAWLKRRTREAYMTLGEAALTLQQTMQQEPTARPRRRERQSNPDTKVLLQAQDALDIAQQQFAAYEDAQTLLTECIDHTTPGQRTLVEYYLMLDELIQNEETPVAHPDNARLHALQEVLHRVEHLGMPGEEA